MFGEVLLLLDFLTSAHNNASSWFRYKLVRMILSKERDIQIKGHFISYNTLKNFLMENGYVG
jgi:hypothetical protein